MEQAKNVLGGKLNTCSLEPLTGFYRDGCCKTGDEDAGTHTVCAQMTAEFLDYTNKNGVMTRPAWQLMNKLKMFKGCYQSNLENAKYLEERIVNIPSSAR